jgi:hypothetical protein
LARQGVVYESVKHAAIMLLSQGIAPSVQKVREILGTGSNTTLAEYLTLWREEQQQERQEQSENRWLKLIDQAREETKTLRKKLEALLHQREEEIKQLKEEHTIFQQEIYTKNAQLKIAEDTLHSFTQQVPLSQASVKMKKHSIKNNTSRKSHEKKNLKSIAKG